MKPSAPEPGSRIDLIDALRGSALAGILLLHSVEHWDFFFAIPGEPPAWLRACNEAFASTAFFLFAGKSYAVFALMFGVSFCLILDRWSKRGIPFQGRFLWRLTILAAFGYVLGLLYCGDILLIIALLGLPLAFLYRLGQRALIVIAGLLLLQLPSAVEACRVLGQPAYQPAQPLYWPVYGRLFDVFAHGSFLDVLKINSWTGQSARLLWTLETGRYTQMLGLFVCGLLIGRAQLLQHRDRSLQLARHALIWGVLGFVLFSPLRSHLGDWGLRDSRLRAVDELVGAWLNLAQMSVWVGGFVFLYQCTPVRRALQLFAPYGRMSLTGYITQALIAIPLFYNFGFGFYRWAGPFYSVLIGAMILVVQIAAAHWWLKHFAYGPFEWLWRSLTFLSFKTPIRKRPPATAEQPARPELASA
jgi:uncharacterized protein